MLAVAEIYITLLNFPQPCEKKAGRILFSVEAGCQKFIALH